MSHRSNIVLGVRNVYHWFGPKLVLHDLDIEIGRGQICSLVGPSGCGKSTLLRAILGTHPPRRGEIIAYHDDPDGKVVVTPGRDRGIVYQRSVSYTHLRAHET